MVNKMKRKIFLTIVLFTLTALSILNCELREVPTYPDKKYPVYIKKIIIEPNPIVRLNTANLSIEVDETIGAYEVEYFSDSDSYPVKQTDKTATWFAPVNASEFQLTARVYAKNISEEIRGNIKVLNRAPVISSISRDNTVCTSISDTNLISITVSDSDTFPVTELQIKISSDTGSCSPDSFTNTNFCTVETTWKAGTIGNTYTVTITVDATDDGDNATSETCAFTVIP
jgi:hypothetical protein